MGRGWVCAGKMGWLSVQCQRCRRVVYTAKLAGLQQEMGGGDRFVYQQPGSCMQPPQRERQRFGWSFVWELQQKQQRGVPGKLAGLHGSGSEEQGCVLIRPCAPCTEQAANDAAASQPAQGGGVERQQAWGGSMERRQGEAAGMERQNGEVAWRGSTPNRPRGTAPWRPTPASLYRQAASQAASQPAAR